MKLVCFIAIIFSFLLFSGCKNNSFFDIQDSMKAPSYSKSENDLFLALNSYFKNGFTWSYQYLNDKYCCVVEHDFKNNMIYNLVFCKDEIDSQDIHILFLKKDKNLKWQVFGDIKISEDDLDKVYLKDINNYEVDEILILRKNADDFEKYTIVNFDENPKVKKIEN